MSTDNQDISNKLAVNDAVSQYDRWLRALKADYAPVDHHSFEQLLIFTVKFGGLIHFYNLDNEIEGDWRGFFQADPLMVLLIIDDFNVAETEQTFEGLLAQVNNSETDDSELSQLSHFIACFDFILKQARQLNDWMLALYPSSDNATVLTLGTALQQLIATRLVAVIDQLKAYALGGALRGGLGVEIPLNFEGFLPLWDLACVRGNDSIYQGRNSSEKIAAALPYLKPIFADIIAVIADLQPLARAGVPTADDHNRHRPQIALTMAFARLFRYAQNTINTLGSRLRQFYYDQVLKARPRDCVGDQLYLNFVLAEVENLRCSTVAKGALFSGGENSDGQAIEYQTNGVTTVSTAAISQIVTLTLQHANWLSNAPVERISLKQIMLDQPPEENRLGWPTFGCATIPPETPVPNLLGFTIASPCLLLTGGERLVTVDIHYNQDYYNKILHPLLQALQPVSRLELSATGIMCQVLTEAFTVSASSCDGWFDISDCAVCATGDKALDELEALEEMCSPNDVDPQPIDQTTLRLCFRLTEDAPALEAYVGDDVPLTECAAVPTLKVYIKQLPVTIAGGGQVYPLSLLSGMVVDNIQIRANVKGLSPSVVANTEGPVDTQSPFSVFGSLPVVGAYLQLSQPEIFAKNPVDLEVAIQWFNLPANDDGFAGYYRDYSINLEGMTQQGLFDNDVFKADISIVNPGHWSLLSAKRSVDLFGSASGQNKKLLEQRIFTSLDAVKANAATVPPDRYYDPAQSAIRLTLSEPAYAFGQVLFAQNVLNLVRDADDKATSAPNESECLLRCEQQYQPVATAISDMNSCRTNCILPDNKPEMLKCMKTKLFKHTAFSRLPSVDVAQYLKIAEVINDTIKKLDNCVKNNRKIEKCRECMLGVLQTGLTILEDYRKEATDACTQNCLNPEEPVKYPSDPYIPQAVSVAINYKSDCQLFEDPDDVFCHLLPVTGERVIKPSEDGSLTLLPQFDQQGYLYIGLTAVDCSPLSLLFVMGQSRGSDLPAVNWQLLAADNHWQNLNVIDDTSGGLQHNGIVTLDLTEPGLTELDVAEPCYWLRASVDGQAGDFAATVQILPHGVLTRLIDCANHSEHLRQPLPLGTVSEAVDDLADIALINQPLASFSGLSVQPYDAFEVSLGERLCHKDRAIVDYDYVRLVLDRFPSIWQVRVLPAHDKWTGGKPCQVLVVVVAGPNSSTEMDPTMPMAEGGLLSQIEHYLQCRASPFVNIRVCNPIYWGVKVDVCVVFSQTAASGDLTRQLNEALVAYLSPWFYDDARAALGANYVSEAAIAAFIGHLPYVEMMAGIGLSYQPLTAQSSSESTRQADWHFLTSVPQHDIEVKSVNPCPGIEFGCAQEKAS
jgi:hypothetical protein